MLMKKRLNFVTTTLVCVSVAATQAAANTATLC